MLVKLSEAVWTQRKGVKLLTKALGPDDIRWVGGAIRDSLLGKNVKDVDCATKLHPDKVTEKCEKFGVKVIPTGLDHGTVTAVLEDGNIEITTLRQDISTDGRRAKITFSESWKDDASRRDFTINALYAHPITYQIFDYYGGLEDLENKRVRFIGDPLKRISEDYLRILRYFRFQARFGAQFDLDADRACEALATSIKGLSRERIAGEFLALLTAENPHPVIVRMFDLGVMRQFLPETEKNNLDCLELLINTESESRVSPNPMRRLAALLPPNDKIAEIVASRFRLSKKQRKYLAMTARREPNDLRNPEALTYRLGKEIAADRMLLMGSEISDILDWELPRFSLTGGYIVNRGVETGPEVAAILSKVEERWVKEKFPGHGRILEILEEELRGRSSS
jgi:poly(A) polymerase